MKPSVLLIFSALIACSSTASAEPSAWKWTAQNLGASSDSAAFGRAKIVENAGSLSIDMAGLGGDKPSLFSCQRNEDNLICVDEAGTQFAGIFREGKYEKCNRPEAQPGKTTISLRDLAEMCKPLDQPIYTFIFLHSDNLLLLIEKSATK